MDNEAEMIRRQMEQTRSSLRDKVEKLEQTLEETVETVKDTFDLKQQFRRHPWTMVCGAAAVGFLGARLLEGIRAAPPSVPFNPAPQSSVAAAFRPARAPATRHWWDTLLDEYRSELDKVKGLAFSALGGFVGEALTEAAPPALKDRIKEVVDSVTVKLGGQPLKEPLFSAHHAGRTNGAHREEMSSSPGSERRDWGEGSSRFDM